MDTGTARAVARRRTPKEMALGVGRDWGHLLGELLLDLVAELSGALACGAVGIEREVSVEVAEEGGIIFLEEMDVGEQAVDDGDARGKGAGLFGGGESIWETVLV